MQLDYLTVQDVLWINLQVTKKVHRFNYARLEEATYYQYAYGDSTSLVPQAARFLTGFLKMAPLEAGNEPTAFVACLAFLVLNGRHLDLSDDRAADWFADVRSGKVKAADAIATIAKEGHTGHHDVRPNIRQAIVDVLNNYPQTIAAIANSSAVPA